MYRKSPAKPKRRGWTSQNRAKTGILAGLWRGEEDAWAKRPGRMDPPSPVRRAGLQGQRMQLTAHLGFERLIDDLVLLDA